MMRHLFLVAVALVLRAGTMQAQTVDQLLARLGDEPEGPERLGLLAKVTRMEVAQGNTEEALDLAEIGVKDAVDADETTLIIEFELVLATCYRAQNDGVQCLTHGLRAFSYSNGTEDTAHAKSALFLASCYRDQDALTKAADYAQQAINTGSLSPKDQCQALWIRARSLLDLNDHANAAAALERLLSTAKDAGDKAMVRNCLQMLVEQRTASQDIEGAINAAETLLGSSKGMDLGIASNNLGELYGRLGRDDQAAKYFTDASTLLFADADLYGRTLINLAVCQGRQKQFISAASVIDNAIYTIGGRGSGTDLAQALQTKAGILLLAGRYNEARSTGEQALDRANAENDQAQQLSSLELLSRIALERGSVMEKQALDERANDLRAAMLDKETRTQRERIDSENQLHRQELDIMSAAANEQRSQSRVREAILAAETKAAQFDWFVSDQQFRDASVREEALAREKAQQELRLVQTALSAERQQRDIQRLEDQRTVQMLRLTKLDLEQKQKENAMNMLKRQNDLLEIDGKLKQADQHRDQMVSRFAVLIVTLLLGVIGFIFWINRQVRAKNRLIRTQVGQIKQINQELSGMNGDLMSSIEYARHIQAAIMPNAAAFEQALPDSFLFYKPRDLVSGDLPFIQSTKDHIYIASIDCTGHGVPAAMLSFVAYYNLHEIIEREPSASPGYILARLHQRVLSTFGEQAGQREHVIADGMDIGLCRMDLRTAQLTFAGAAASMITVRNGEPQRIKGGVRSIGDRFGSGDPVFDDHVIDMCTGDRMYLFSDGLIHQFGGAQGRKKFSLQRLASLLGELHETPQKKIHGLITEQFEQWKGDVSQTDDILLIGFGPAAMANSKAA